MTATAIRTGVTAWDAPHIVWVANPRTRIHSPTPATRDVLLAAYASQSDIGLRDAGTSTVAIGKITSIRLESGFTPPALPRHFLVRLKPTGDKPEVEIYVRTAP